MGAETSVLQECKLEDPLPTPSQKDWTIHPAQRKDGSRVSVFVHKKKQETESPKEQHLENAARQLKILRHPTILKFFASCENVDGTFLITEQVKPLDLVIDSITPEEICAGLYNVVEALSFLHERGNVSHNNVCMSSIYVSSQDGGWRLGGMEHLCKFEDATVQFLKQSKPLRNAQCIPPEEDVESLTSTAPSYGHARDAYAFGVLAQNMLEYLGDLGEMTDTFEASIERMLDLEPTHRPKLGILMGDKLFKNDFLEITNFVKKLTLKGECEKNTFFEGLAARMHRLPKQLVASRLAPLVLSSFVMAEPMAINHLFPHLLTPCRDVGSSKRHHEFLPDQINPLIPLELFKRYVIPVLGKIFPSRELHVRNVLLRHFSSYGDLFYEDKLQNLILPQLLIGLKDIHDDIVAASLRALSDLVPILGAKTVVGGERTKYFVEGRPKFPKPKASPVKGDVPYLTAVSGVITLPMLDKALTQTPVKSKEIMTSDPPSPQVTNNGDVNQALRKQERERQREERERRREEMRKKNEERRKERERKKQEIGKVTLVSLAQTHGKDASSDSSNDDDNSTVPSISSSEHRPEVELPKTQSQSYEIVQDSEASTEESDKADWSDWDDVEQSKDEPISIQNSNDLATIGQSESMLHASKDVVRPLDTSRTSNGKKETSDWSDDWNETETDLSISKQDEQVPKKKTNALQLKSSLKKKDNLKKTREPKAKDESVKQSVANKTQNERKTSNKSANNAATTHKTSTVRYKAPQELGKEYDIPDITVVTTPEPDFFADMEPMMRFGSGSASTVSVATKVKESSKAVVAPAATTMPVTTSASNPISFAVDNTTVTEADDDGWGADDDDFNWDEEEEEQS